MTIDETAVDLAALASARDRAQVELNEATECLRVGALLALVQGRTDHDVAGAAGVDVGTVRKWAYEDRLWRLPS
jgi:hypothetical protein